MRFLIVTLGCAKNEVDSDRMRALLLADGFEETADVANADVAIVNTCSFLASATEESVEATLSLAEERAEGVRDLPIVMCGCVPSRYGDALASELPEVAAFVRAEDEDGIVAVVRRVLGLGEGDGEERPETLRTVEGTSAFVKISEGCDRFCTFCAIPYIRGRYHSRPTDEVLASGAVGDAFHMDICPHDRPRFAERGEDFEGRAETERGYVLYPRRR